ncbi:Uncharacterized protein OBRU01_00029 [Operophtera brumata]|uniref:Nucleolar protein 10-like N-terminal domain-containing protein n=1 Tax=Operophtera brumata TaxID=104452 RepID=A0A0L7LVT3_OPEBR|nr:Uncharacterized protein OBRU01_00029 [Operophtera brumata]
MQVSEIDNVKIYNLSVGKSLPDWLTERKKRALLKKNVDLRRRIELIQEFDMPGVSTSLRVSKDGQYIMTTGIYKPRIKCFDVNNLSLKFERCLDSEVVTFEILSEDYTKEVYRLNLELGQFLAPYVTKATEVNCCDVSEDHGLLVLGTASGHVEAWDPQMMVYLLLLLSSLMEPYRWGWGHPQVTFCFTTYDPANPF